MAIACAKCHKEQKTSTAKTLLPFANFFVSVCLYTLYCFAFALRALTVQKKQLLFFHCEGVTHCGVAVCVRFCCRVTNFCYRLCKNVQFYG